MCRPPGAQGSPPALARASKRMALDPVLQNALRLLDMVCKGSTEKGHCFSHIELLCLSA